MINEVIKLVKQSTYQLAGYTYLPLSMPPLENYIKWLKVGLLKKGYRIKLVKDKCLIFRSQGELDDMEFIESYEKEV